MKQLYIILTCLVILIYSCEKYPEKGSFGNPLLKYHGDAYVDLGLSVSELQDGYLITGMRTLISRSESNAGESIIDSSRQELAVIKTDKSGNMNWTYSSETSGYDEGRSIITLDDGSMVCAGVTEDPETGNDILITKLSAGGSPEWQEKYGGKGNQEANDIIEAYDGGYIIAGYSDAANIAEGFGLNNPEGKKNVYLLKINSQGDSIWSCSYGFEGNESGIKVVRDISGTGYMIMATTDQSAQGQDQNNLMLFRTNSFGNSTSYKTFGNTSNESAVDIMVDGNTYLVLGESGSGADINTEIYILRLSEDIYTQPLLEKRIGISEKPLAINSFCSHPSGFYVIAGGIGDILEEDMLFYFIDSEGNQYTKPHIPEGQGSQIINDVIVDSGENIVAVGTNGTETSSLITFYKFGQPDKQ